MRLLQSLLILFVIISIGTGSIGASQQTGWQQVASQVVHGEILEVHPGAGKVRVLTQGQILILTLKEDCQILRNNQGVSINSLRPIADGRYQEGLFIQDSMGFITHVFVHFYVEEQYDEAHGSALIFTDIFGNVKEIEHL